LPQRPGGDPAAAAAVAAAADWNNDDAVHVISSRIHEYDLAALRVATVAYDTINGSGRWTHAGPRSAIVAMSVFAVFRQTLCCTFIIAYWHHFYNF